MRSALTTLGIIIGVGAVIAMLAVGTRASNQMAEQIASMGSNLLIVVPGSQTSGGLRMVLEPTHLTSETLKRSRRSAGPYRTSLHTKWRSPGRVRESQLVHRCVWHNRRYH